MAADLLAVREELVTSIHRWSAELHADVRLTVACGIEQRCYNLVGKIMKICAETAIAITGQAGSFAVANCAAGKSVGRMTLGQHVQVLKNLNGELTRAVAPIYVTSHAALLSGEDLRLLEAIVSKRNQFAHDAKSSRSHDVISMLEEVSRFCALELISAVAAVRRSQDS